MKTILTGYAVDGSDWSKHPNGSYCRQVEVIGADCVLHRTTTQSDTQLILSPASSSNSHFHDHMTPSGSTSL